MLSYLCKDGLMVFKDGIKMMILLWFIIWIALTLVDDFRNNKNLLPRLS